ncbi:Protein trichome birefringence [Dichanthelium oligosanthes]|uniref:Protein trichome birefringence n=1 Tax=Dichanthelium oligosanthes TaxID=888268 RepID=A0A1E5WIG0_9POAL|nr:Protein trichome birefringence [Dichanthelium oligosanthes]
MKSLWKQSGGLVCADAGPLSPLGGRSWRRARLTLYGFAVAFAAFTAYVAFATPSSTGANAGAEGAGASWFGGVYASTAPYRSQISSIFSSILPANAPAPSPEPLRAPAGGSGGGGGGEVGRDVSGGRVGIAAGSDGSAAAGSSKQLGSGGGAPIGNAGGGSVPPASNLAGTGIGGKGGGGAPPNNSASSGGTPNGALDPNKGVSSTKAGGGSGSPASSASGDGTVAKAGGQSVDSSNKQSGSGSGAPSDAAAGHGNTVRAEANVGGGAPSNNSAGSSNLGKVDLSTGSSNYQAGSGSGVPTSGSASGNSSSVKADAKGSSSNNQAGSGSVVPTSGSASGNSSSVKADAQGSVRAGSSGSSGSGTEKKAGLSKSSDAQPGSGNGDASHKSAGNSSPAKSTDTKAGSNSSSDAQQGSGNGDGSHKSTGSSSPAKSTDTKASSNNSSDAQSGSGSGDASHKSAGSSSPAKSNAGDGGGERNSSSVSVVPTSNQSGSLALAGEKEVGSPRKNNTVVASPAVKNQEQTSSGVASDGNSGTVKKQKGDATQGSADSSNVEFFRSPFLVQEWEMQVSDGKKKETLRLDLVEQSSPKYKDADFLIFNTGHWWTHEKTALGKDYYQEGNHVYSELNVVDAFHKALLTWSKWIDANINPRKTTVLFRGYSASHFSGGQWNSGGSCDRESEPITNQQYLSTYPPKMSILEDVIHKMKTPVVYLNITRMTDYRKDAHPSIYRKQNLTDEERRSPERYQDCSHWCLPGVPDSWNELVYAQLLIRQHQMRQQ